MDQLAYKATKAMVGYKVNSISKSVKGELGFGDDKKNDESEHDKQKRLVVYGLYCILHIYIQYVCIPIHCYNSTVYTVLECACVNSILNLSAWEYQSAALGYNYHTARQSGAATVRYISYHPVITNLSPCCGATLSRS